MNEWEARWREGRTGWDRGRSAPALVSVVERGELPDGRALVPGCGAGYDVLTLASPERQVLGLDIAPTAVSRFSALRSSAGVPEERARVEVADFFTFDPGPERFSLIFDYTFLCALPPSRRAEWAERVDELLAPAGELLTLIYPVLPGVMPSVSEPGEGPPYPMHPEHVRDLLAGRFEPFVLEPLAHSHPERQGKEWLGRWRRG